MKKINLISLVWRCPDMRGGAGVNTRPTQHQHPSNYIEAHTPAALGAPGLEF